MRVCQKAGLVNLSFFIDTFIERTKFSKIPNYNQLPLIEQQPQNLIGQKKHGLNYQAYLGLMHMLIFTGILIFS